ncbi:ionotropic receptor 40a [Anthonomus grandis grandis]|uniref:ionotropic receptor 40a n=1 Tax=Anthonomus grandis grandis TaxID=2921223 RepID=UPI002165FD2E|nr:ionotropic receptor 40a [Anthonomus grandis grandis]
MALARIIGLCLISKVIEGHVFVKNIQVELGARIDYGGDLATALCDMMVGFPETNVAIGFDKIENDFLRNLLVQLESKRVSVLLFNFTLAEAQDKYFEYLSVRSENHLPVVTLFFGSHKLYEHILLEVYDCNCIRRNIVHIFNWGRGAFTRSFLKNIHYAMKVFAITNPRNDTFRIYYNQATLYREHHLEMINWWNQDKGLFHHPTVPKKKSVYKDFHEKVLQVPVLHKPPWHFVRYNATPNKSFEVIGGRDHRILVVLSKKLNFRYNYTDPPERIQGSAESGDNGDTNGVLGLLARREADLFIGDMGITYERSNIIEFSFITLADTGAFVTHAPSKLNEALALLRPFQWQVWPAIGVTCIIVGPFLYALIALPNTWRPHFRVRSHARLFFDCTWFTVTILLKQTGKVPSQSHKARFFILVLSISTTYVITDMYSANLTSLLARPGRERAINNLYQLKTVMESKNFKLFAEKHSPTFGLLENGTGIYGQIWDLMEKNQKKYVVESVEEGVKLVKDNRNVAVMAGRETLFFDIQRFGPTNFHLSEKLNTAYSAIALQFGCPYIEEINEILMALFEAGIINKMTENEYEKLGKQKEKLPDNLQNDVPTTETATKKAVKVSEDNEKLKPIRLKMLQGTFYLLFIGNIFAGLVLLVEVLCKKYHKEAKKKKKTNNNGDNFFKKFWKRFHYYYRRIKRRLRRAYLNFMHDAFTRTLEYID